MKMKSLRHFDGDLILCVGSWWTGVGYWFQGWMFMLSSSLRLCFYGILHCGLLMYLLQQDPKLFSVNIKSLDSECLFFINFLLTPVWVYHKWLQNKSLGSHSLFFFDSFHWELSF